MKKYLHINWKPEFQRLDPFLTGQGGVVRIRFDTLDCAPHIFNEVLKNKFDRTNNGVWISIRIDPEWHTTHRLSEFLHEFDKKLSVAGFPCGVQGALSCGGDLFSGNTVDGNYNVNIKDSQINLYSGSSAKERDAGILQICNRLRIFLGNGGHMMIVVNDAPYHDQAQFWRNMWQDRLSEFVRFGLVLVHFVGPDSNFEVHHHAPEAETELHLPSSVKTDDQRQDDIYDDLIDRAYPFESGGHKLLSGKPW